MSFGTFNLFNFFQQPNTGKTPVPGSFNPAEITAGQGQSGAVFDANWTFPYAGTLVPYEIVEGGGGLFSIKLSSDLDFEAPLEFGLRFVDIQTTFSGNLQGNREISFIQENFSGSFFPMDIDNSTNFLVFSGLVTGSPPDISPSYIHISGQIIAAQPDFAYPFIVFSGGILDDTPNISKLKYVVSGNITSGNIEPSHISTTFSGKLIPVNSDTSNISYGVLSFSGLFNKIVSGTSFTNTANLDYGFTSYFSTRGI